MGSVSLLSLHVFPVTSFSFGFLFVVLMHVYTPFCMLLYQNLKQGFHKNMDMLCPQVPAGSIQLKADMQVVYIGPELKNIISRNTIFKNGIPAEIEEKLSEMPLLLHCHIMPYMHHLFPDSLLLLAVFLLE